MAAGSRERHILLLGGGFRPNGAGGRQTSPLMDYLFAVSGRDRPKVCGQR
jgi:hypothetical protein